MCPAMHWSGDTLADRRPEQAPRNRRQEETFRKVLDGRHGNAAREVLRRPDGARRGGPRQSGAGDRLHLLLVEEPPDRRGLPRLGPAGPLLHRRQRPHAGAGGDRRCATWRWWSPTNPRSRRPARRRCSAAAPIPRCAAARDRIGAEIHRRITSAIGPGADPRHVSALEMAFFGALVAGRQRRIHLSRNRRPAGLRGQPHPGRRGAEDERRNRGASDDRARRDHELVLDPYDYDFHEDPYPYYKRLRDEAPLYHNEELRFWALSRHQDVLRASATAQHCPTATACRWTRSRGARTRRRRCRSWRWTIRPTCGCARWCRKASPAAHSGTRAAGHRAAPEHLDAMLEKAIDGTVDYIANSPASCRWT